MANQNLRPKNPIPQYDPVQKAFADFGNNLRNSFSQIEKDTKARLDADRWRKAAARKALRQDPAARLLVDVGFDLKGIQDLNNGLMRVTIRGKYGVRKQVDIDRWVLMNGGKQFASRLFLQLQNEITSEEARVQQNRMYYYTPSVTLSNNVSTAATMTWTSTSTTYNTGGTPTERLWANEYLNNDWSDEDRYARGESPEEQDARMFRNLLSRGNLDDFKIPNEHAVFGLTTPDGTKIKYDRGHISVIDDKAKTTYKANRNREFNKYLNASDLIEEFILFLGELGVKQSEVMDIPVDVLIHWLIMRAAMEDGEDVPEDVNPRQHPALVKPRTIHGDRCLCCNKFITRAQADTGLMFCSEQHMLIFVQRKGVWGENNVSNRIGAGGGSPVRSLSRPHGSQAPVLSH